MAVASAGSSESPRGEAVPFFLLVPILLVMALVGLVVAIVAAVVFIASAFTLLVAALILHKLGYDRRLVAFLMRRFRPAHIVKVEVDEFGVPVTKVWTFGRISPQKSVDRRDWS
jgi:hypothetical protein